MQEHDREHERALPEKDRAEQDFSQKDVFEPELLRFETYQSEKHTGRNWKKILFITISMIFTVFLTLFTFLYTKFLYFPYDAAEMAKVKETCIRKWDAANSIPMQDNGWFQYEKALNLFGATLTDKEREQIEKIDENGIKTNDYAFLESMEKKHARVLSLLDEGLEKPEFQIPINYSQNYGRWRRIAPCYLYYFPCFLIQIGDYEKKKGNCDEAARRYLQLVYLGHGLGRNTDESSFLYGTYRMEVSLERLICLINEADQKAISYNMIVKEMQHIDRKRSTLAEVFEFEAASYELFIEEIPYLGNNAKELEMYFHVPAGLRKFALTRDMKARSSHLFSVSKANEGTFKETLGPLKKIKEPEIRLVDYLGNAGHGFPVDYALASALTYHARAKYGGLEILAALKWYRKEKGAYPDDLAALVPGYLKSLPKDPFADDGNYLYKKDGEEVLLYSIGPDLKDDKGLIISKRGDEPGDIVFTRRKASPGAGKQVTEK